MGGTTEGPNNERRGNCMKRNGIASDNLLLQAVALPQDEFVTGHSRQIASIPPQALLEQVLERANLQRALKQVRRRARMGFVQSFPSGFSGLVSLHPPPTSGILWTASSALGSLIFETNPGSVFGKTSGKN